MKVDLTHPNTALRSIYKNPKQIITLDANCLIPPDRSSLTRRTFRFQRYQEFWLDPIFSAFPNLAIHEAVYEELVSISLQRYVEEKINSNPPEIIIHQDSSLSEKESNLRNSIESKLAPFTKYDPINDNREDRGEVKSLSFIAVKNLPYFAAHDNNAIQLIKKSEKWSTGLDNVQAIKMYEIIYYLNKNNLADSKAMKMLYKYLYFLSSYEKKSNPNWGTFVSCMDNLYC